MQLNRGVEVTVNIAIPDYKLYPNSFYRVEHHIFKENPNIEFLIIQGRPFVEIPRKYFLTRNELRLEKLKRLKK